MPRPAWKGPLLAVLNTATNPPTAQRNATILPSHVGRKVLVHSGRTLVPVAITEPMVSRKFGELVPTRRPVVYRKKDDGPGAKGSSSKKK